MSVAASTAIGLGVAAGTAGAGAYAAHKSSSSADRAGDLNARASADQLAYLKAKDLQDQQNWYATQAENRRQYDSTMALNVDQYNRREGRLAPYRGIGAGATGTLRDLINVPMVRVPQGAALPPGVSAPPPPNVSTATAPAAPAPATMQAFLARTGPSMWRPQFAATA